MKPGKGEELKKLDTRLEEPFIIEWDRYKFFLEDNCYVVEIIFEEKGGAKIGIPLTKKHVKLLRKQLKKIENILL